MIQRKHEDDAAHAGHPPKDVILFLLVEADRQVQLLESQLLAAAAEVAQGHSHGSGEGAEDAVQQALAALEAAPRSNPQRLRRSQTVPALRGRRRSKTPPCTRLGAAALLELNGFTGESASQVSTCSAAGGSSRRSWSPSNAGSNATSAVSRCESVGSSVAAGARDLLKQLPPGPHADALWQHYNSLLDEQQALRFCVGEQSKLNAELREECEEQKRLKVKIGHLEEQNEGLECRAPRVEALWHRTRTPIARPEDMKNVVNAKQHWERSRMAHEDLGAQRTRRAELHEAEKTDWEMLPKLQAKLRETDNALRDAQERVQKLREDRGRNASVLAGRLASTRTARPESPGPQSVSLGSVGRRSPPR